jgi:membrane protein YqaA with SNARE-associated domain
VGPFAQLLVYHTLNAQYLLGHVDVIPDVITRLPGINSLSIRLSSKSKNILGKSGRFAHIFAYAAHFFNLC